MEFSHRGLLPFALLACLCKRTNAQDAYNTVEKSEQGLTYAQNLIALNQQVPVPTNDMTAMKAELQARLESGIAAIKAELDYRTAIVELRSMTGCEE